MGLKPLVWYCRPVTEGLWSRVVVNAFGAYTPCAIESVVIGISHLALFGVCFYRTWLISRDVTLKRFCLRSKYYNFLLSLLAAYCTFEPLFRLLFGFSIMNIDGQHSLPPFEVVSLLVKAVAWCCMLVMIGTETKVYVHEFRWYVRFVVIYVLVGETAAFNLVYSVREYYDESVFYLYTSEIVCQFLFGLLLLIYMPNLDPFPGYTPIRAQVFDDNTEYELLPGEEQICPERKANILSRILFSWMTPLMQQGFKKPITEKDVWKLDTWDATETLYNNFQKHWLEESKKPKPWLLRALHGSLGGRFWLGGFFKIGNDLSQFVGPTILNLLLQDLWCD